MWGYVTIKKKKKKFPIMVVPFRRGVLVFFFLEGDFFLVETEKVVVLLKFSIRLEEMLSAVIQVSCLWL